MEKVRAMSLADGKRHELLAMIECERRGYSCAKASAGNQKHWDLIVNGLRLQVKKRSIDMTKPNNIRLVTSRTSSAVVYSLADVDAFALMWRCEWYVFLASYVADLNGLIRNGIYMPNVMHFRNKWGVLVGQIASQPQMQLFSGLEATDGR